MLHKSFGKLPLLLAGGVALLLSGSAFAAKIKPAKATPAPAANPSAPVPAAPAAPAGNKDDVAFFKSKVEPILAERCYKCHSNAEGKTKGGLALDTRDGMMKGGEDGKVLDTANLSKSMLMTRLLSKDKEEKMPPKDANLTPAELATLTAWVNKGAPYPTDTGLATTGDPKAAIKAKDTTAGRSHWAWQPLKNVLPPANMNPQWSKTAIDTFIVAKLAQKRMAPSPLADRASLIRRAYYDLVGLPPMPWEVQAFVDDKAPNAWEKVIDKLLVSPHYGERWGRYWLDVARYSDTKGEANKKDSPLYVDAWTYRDYVIDAFNKDKPYDQFIIEQIAADKLKLGQDKRPLAALGFLTVGDRFANKKDDIINDRIDTVSKAFLGLTVACARCHDHMFDPIPQKDYYSLHGVFASTAEPKDNPIIAAQTDAKLYQDYLKAREEATRGAMAYVKGEFERVRKIFHQHAGDLLMAQKNNGQDKRKYIEAVGGNAKNVGEIAQMVLRGSGTVPRQNPVVLPFLKLSEIPEKDFSSKAPAVCEQIAANNERRGPKVNPLLAAAFKGQKPTSMDDVAEIYNKFFQEIEKKAAQAKPDPATKLAGGISPATDENLALMIAAPFSLDPMKDFDIEQTKAFPQQIAYKIQNLMSAVTQVEMTHPGAPKRAMVVQDAPVAKNSQVYIRGEAGNKGEVAPRRFLEILSPANRPEFKDGSGRLELAQAIASKTNPLTARVMMNRIWLHHFGEGIVPTPDDFGTMSGAPSHPELLDYLANRFMQRGWSVKAMHKEIMMSAVYQQVTETNEAYAKADPENTLLWHYPMRRLELEPLRDSLLYIAGELDLKVGGQPVNILSEPYSMRRSVYGYIDRRELPEMMNYFDFANPSMSTGKRHETTVPQQALFMMNSPLVVDVARKLLNRPEMSLAKTDAQRVHALYWMVYQRPPKPTEIELGLKFVQAMTPADAIQLASNSVEPESAQTTEPVTRKKGKKGGPPGAPQLTLDQKKALAQANQKKRGGITLVNSGEMVDRAPLNAWEKYTQALLMANEMVYYN
jgi:hypothetical protein